MKRGNTIADQIAALRANRPAWKPTVSIAGEVAAVGKDAARRAGSATSAQERWGGLVPEAIAGRVRPGPIVKGVLTAVASDASARFAMDRWLGGGGEAVLREQLKGVRMVRVILEGGGAGPGR